MRHDLPDSTRMPRRWGGLADGLGASLIDLLVVEEVGGRWAGRPDYDNCLGLDGRLGWRGCHAVRGAEDHEQRCHQR